jgi:hypothetical protein
MRIECRNSGKGDDGDTLIQVMDEGSVVQAWPADGALISDFLNDMDDLHDRKGIEIGQKAPQDWGKLVLSRSENGGILQVDPDVYWDRVQHWFRSRGDDPNKWGDTH